MRVKLYMLSLLPNAVIAGWLTIELGRMLGPLLVAPRDVAFLLVMAFVAGGTFVLLNLILMLVLGVRLVQKGGQMVFVERAELANMV